MLHILVSASKISSKEKCVLIAAIGVPTFIAALGGKMHLNLVSMSSTSTFVFCFFNKQVGHFLRN